MKRLEAVVRGRVQGVGFRAFVAERAKRLGVRGWVKNEWDGGVKVVAEGSEQALDALTTALREGPSLAHVNSVAIDWEADQNEALPPFEIR